MRRVQSSAAFASIFKARDSISHVFEQELRCLSLESLDLTFG